MLFEITSEFIQQERSKAQALRKQIGGKTNLPGAFATIVKSRSKKLLTMDHIVPVSRGGYSIKSNIVTACKDCNTAKKDLTAAEWMLEKH
ncbi:MAG: HNH endonuclease signature motif containing protein [Bdellovibrionota bacterium]